MLRKRLVMLALASMVSACSGTSGTRDFDFSSYTTKQAYPGRNASLNRYVYPGHYKVGNPYEIQGVVYRPREDPTYQEVGMASWYGPTFHGKGTANGDRFDQNALTAAHKTLPLPSVVKVTNLGNGQTLMVMVNDRGPFSKGRIIDVSKRAAQLLGFERQGVAKVKVEYLKGQSDRLLQELALTRTPEKTLVSAAKTLPQRPVMTTSTGDYIVTEPVANKGVFIQVGAYGRPDNAANAQNRLAKYEETQIVPTTRWGQTFYRVLMGPFNSRADATAMMQRIREDGNHEMILVAANTL